MKISLDWIKDFTTLPSLPPEKLAERLTLGCAEVEEVQSVGLFWEQVVVAEIVSIEKHPEADKLNLVTFDYGGKEAKKVVCGAGNVRVGLKTAYAPLYTHLPNGMFLEPKKIRGFLSEGMLCSEEELALAETSEGILDLESSLKNGTPLKEVFKKTTDSVIDIDNKSLTHRPDLWGHFGIAREFAALFEVEFKNRFSKDWMTALKSKQTKTNAPIKVKVEKNCAGLAYFGLSVDGVKVEPSPEWMKTRLISAGLRPINNIVDISNYVMLELGVPLHIFDRQKIKGGEVKIHALTEEAKFMTLDEVERTLIPGDTVISDSNGPLVLAGIMGGLESGVSEQTTEIFIEVANWKAAMVRRTSTRLGLRTDSSQRYEKTLDSQLCERTLWRTLELITELCPQASVVGEAQYDGVVLSEITPLEIELPYARVKSVLGTEISAEKIQDILRRLDFSLKETPQGLLVGVPSYRATKDVENEADLIEEIGRVIGYDSIQPFSPAVAVSPVRLSPAQKLHRNLRDFLSLHAHALEVMTYPMIGEKLLKKAQWPAQASLQLVNSLSVDQDRMRPSLIPSLLEVCALNAKNDSSFRFFEIGRSYLENEKNFAEERSQIAVVLFEKEKSPFLDLLNIVERMNAAHNIPADFAPAHEKFKNQVVDESWNGVHPFEFFNIRVMGKMQGVVMSIHPLVLREFKIKGHVSLAILDLTDLEKRELKEKTKYLPLPKFPGSIFDCTVVANKDIQVGNILDSLKSFKPKELQSVKVVDVYPLSESQKTVTLRASFLDPDKTLSGEFLTNAGLQMVETLNKSGFPLKP